MSLTILIAEDETDVLHFLLRAIERIKPEAQLLAASDGNIALTLFQQHRCDLIISDHRMPHMTGLALLVAVRQSSAVPFVMISAETQLRPQAIAAGATLFLDKPLSLTVLRAAVLQCLP